MTLRQIKKTFHYGIPLAAAATVGIFAYGTLVFSNTEIKPKTQTQVTREANPLEEAVCDALIIKGRAEKGFTPTGAMEKQNVYSKPTSQEDYTQSNLSTPVYNDLFARLNPGKNTRVITIDEEYNFPVFDKFADSLDVYKLTGETPVDFETARKFSRTPAGNCKFRLSSFDIYDKKVN